VTFFDSSQQNIFFIVIVNGKKGDHNESIDKPHGSFEAILCSSGLFYCVGSSFYSYVAEEHVVYVFRVNEL